MARSLVCDRGPCPMSCSIAAKPDRSLESLARVRDQTLERSKEAAAALVPSWAIPQALSEISAKCSGWPYASRPALDIAVVKGVWKRVFPKTKLFDMPPDVENTANLIPATHLLRGESHRE